MFALLALLAFVLALFGLAAHLLYPLTPWRR